MGAGHLISEATNQPKNTTAPSSIDNPSAHARGVAQVVSTSTEIWGVVEISPSGTLDTSVSKVENPEGGTWSYGHEGTHCWSHYVHPTKKHRATAIMGSNEEKHDAAAGNWARADIYASGGGCKAYFHVY